MLTSRWLIPVLVGLSLSIGARQVAQAQPQQSVLNSVQSLDYAVLPGGKTLVRLTFKNDIKEPPSILASHHPTAHITLDFAGTASMVTKDPLEINQRGLRSLQVIQTGTRTRLVISLVSPHVYETVSKGKELLITLQRPASAASSAGGGQFAAAAPDGPRHGVREVIFQRGDTGEGRIIVELSGTAVPIDVRQQGKTLIVDFLDATLPTQMERRLDVQDFGTAIRAIETHRLGSNVRMKIELEGAGEYSAYQLSRQFIVAPRTGEQ